jgi:hypothetical protein
MANYSYPPDEYTPTADDWAEFMAWQAGVDAADALTAAALAELPDVDDDGAEDAENAAWISEYLQRHGLVAADVF